MNKRLQRILSILCILTLALGGLTLTALAEENQPNRVITLEWKDEDNYDGFRPDQVYVGIGDTGVVLSEGNGWTASVYAPEGAGYTAPQVNHYVTTATGTDVISITCYHSVTRAELSAGVRWEDGDNMQGKRPGSVQLSLLADGKPCGAPLKAMAANNWTVTWKDLYVTRKGREGESIAYSVMQLEELSGYNTQVTGGVTVVNTLQSGTLTLKAETAGMPEGVDVGDLSMTITGPDARMPVTVTMREMPNGTYTLENVLPGAYLVQENNGDSLIEGYVMDPRNTQVGDAAVLKDGESATLNIKYTWQEPVPQEENVNPLEKAGELSIEIQGPDPRMPMTVTYADFENGRYELENLLPGDYAVVERNPEGLVQAYTLKSDSITGLTVTVGRDGAVAALLNKYVPTVTPLPDDALVDIPVSKIWTDDNNKDGNRPDTVTVRLYANGVETDSHVLTAAEGWNYTFEGKPRYDDAHQEITYTVNEDAVPWYITHVRGYMITNEYKPETTSVSVSKVWDDQDNKQEIRPTTLAVRLNPVGLVYFLSAENEWTTTVKNLPTKIDGKEVTYSWSEQVVVGYSQSNKEIKDDMTVFTNSPIEIPEVDENMKKPHIPNNPVFIFEEYDTALGVNVLINHVGDCFD